MQQARIDLGSKRRLRRVGLFFGLGSVLCRELQVQRLSPVGFRFGVLSLETARERCGEASLAHPKANTGGMRSGRMKLKLLASDGHKTCRTRSPFT